MTAAHDLLVRSRAEQGLPPALEDDRGCEQLAALLGANAKEAERPRRKKAAKA